MNSTRNAGRFAGLLYVLTSIPGAVSLIYIPHKLIVSGNAAATAHNIVTSETLFRLSIACNLVTQILFMWVALALYDLFKGVNRRQAVLMVGLIAIPLPIVLMNELNAIAALVLVRGADFLSVFSIPERNALAMLFLDVHGEAFSIAEIFWGPLAFSPRPSCVSIRFCPPHPWSTPGSEVFLLRRSQFCVFACTAIPKHRAPMDDAPPLWRTNLYVLAPHYGRAATVIRGSSTLPIDRRLNMYCGFLDLAPVARIRYQVQNGIATPTNLLMERRE